jgi:hypothetical protein
MYSTSKCKRFEEDICPIVVPPATRGPPARVARCGRSCGAPRVSQRKAWVLYHDQRRHRLKACLPRPAGVEHDSLRVTPMQTLCYFAKGGGPRRAQKRTHAHTTGQQKQEETSNNKQWQEEGKAMGAQLNQRSFALVFRGRLGCTVRAVKVCADSRTVHIKDLCGARHGVALLQSACVCTVCVQEMCVRVWVCVCVYVCARCVCACVGVCCRGQVL